MTAGNKDSSISGSARTLRTCALAAAVFICGCQTPQPTPYQPLQSGAGYTETALGEGIYRISFRGNSATPYRTVEDYLLYRAAELASVKGADTFTIMRNDAPAILVESLPEHTVCHYSPADFSQFVFYPDPFDQSDEVSPPIAYEAYIDIKLGGAPAGMNDPQVYYTTATLESLSSCISRQQDGGSDQ